MKLQSLKSFLFISILLLIGNISYIKTDLPVHCLYSQVYGKWNFQISKESFIPSLTDQATTCGHGFPNRVVKSKLDNTIKNSDLLSLTLTKDFTILDEDNKVIGKYTLVYDEGMILIFNEKTITVHFYYYPKSNDSVNYESDCSKTMKGWLTPDKNNNKKQEKWRCVYGEKESLNKSEDTKYEVNNDHILKHQYKEGSIISNFLNDINNEDLEEDTAGSSFLKTNKNHLKTVNASENHSKNESSTTNFLSTNMKTESMNKRIEDFSHFIKSINTDPNSTWKASISPRFEGMSLLEIHSKLSKNKKLNKDNNMERVNSFLKEASLSNTNDNSKNKSNISYNANKHNKLENNSFLQSKVNNFEVNSTNNYSYSKNHKNLNYLKSDIPREKDSKFVEDYSEVAKYLDTDIKDIDANYLPKNWDWRNVGGVNYISSIKEQGDCGSCYIISTISLLEARL